MSSAAIRGLQKQLDGVNRLISLITLPNLGRALFAATDIPAGDHVFHESPLMCTPAAASFTTSCYNCLRPLQAPALTANGAVNFCSSDCHQGASWWQTESPCFDALAPLRQACLESGEKLPLIALRLACLSLVTDTERHWKPTKDSSTIPPGNPLTDLAELCFANVGPTPPQQWVDMHGLLIQGLRPLGLPLDGVDLDWYTSVLSRLHLNVFRVDTVAVLDMSDPSALLRAAAATITDTASPSHQTGSAVYLLSSMLNHSCEPNLEVTFPDNNATVGLVAGRDIVKNEQLTISYIDLDMGVAQRRQHLQFAYGFVCRCPRCVRELAAASCICTFIFVMLAKPVSLETMYEREVKAAATQISHVCIHPCKPETYQRLCTLKTAGGKCLASMTMLAVILLLSQQRFSPNRSNQGDAFPRSQPWWTELHATLVKEIQKADANKGFDAIFYGDSITETWRGTSAGSPCERCVDVPQVFDEMFGSKYRAAALGMSGDTTQHLLWRLQHGELPAKHPPKVVVLLIGTNDLGTAAHGVEDKEAAEAEVEAEAPAAARRILKIVHLIEAQLPHTQIILMGVLPRASSHRAAGAYRQPSLFTPAVHEINLHLAAYAEQDGRVHYVDCGGEFLNKGGSIDAKLMPDGLHPGAEGAAVMAWCLQPTLDSIVVRALQ